MTTRKYLSLALSAACLAALTGCSSGYGWFGGKQASTLGNPTTTSLAPRPSLLASISEALTIKPKVIPADDPLKVTEKPGKVSAEVYLSAARLYENQGEFEAATGQYRKALEVAPKSLPALIGFARLQDRQSKFEEASRLYKKAIVAHPQSATAYNDLGLCQARHGQPEAALENIQKAVQLEPANKLYRNNAASVLVDMSRSTEALEHLVLAHGEAVAHYNLGFLLFQRDRNEQASEQFALAVEKDSSLVQAREMLNRTGGVAAREPVQRTQHLMETPSRKPAPRKTQGGGFGLDTSAESPIQVSPAFATPRVIPGVSKASPPKDNLRRVPDPEPLEPAQVEPIPPAAVIQGLAQAEVTAPAAIPASELPKHIFPPIRNPEATEPPEDDEVEPAPLPDDTTFPPGQRLRKFPPSDGEE